MSQGAAAAQAAEEKGGRATSIFDEKGRSWRLGISIGGLRAHPYCIIVEEPEQATMIADKLTNVEEVGRRHGAVAYTGTVNTRALSLGGPDTDVPITVATHQTGWLDAARAIVELTTCGVRRIIRVGNADSYEPKVQPGDIAIWHGAMRVDAGIAYMWARSRLIRIPASRTITEALRRAAMALGYPHQVGCGITVADFDHYGECFALLGEEKKARHPGHETARSHGLIGIDGEMAALFAFHLAHQDLPELECGYGEEESLMVGGLTTVYANRTAVGDDAPPCSDSIENGANTALLALAELHHSCPIDPATIQVIGE